MTKPQHLEAFRIPARAKFKAHIWQQVGAGITKRMNLLAAPYRTGSSDLSFSVFGVVTSPSVVSHVGQNCLGRQGKSSPGHESLAARGS